MSKSITIRRTWRGGIITDRMQPLVPVATHAGAEVLLGYSLEEVPVETGALGDTGIVMPAAQGDGHDLVFDSIYAAAQHEIPMNHTPGNNGQPAGKDHYVSDPAREHSKDIYGVMAKILRGAFRG